MHESIGYFLAQSLVRILVAIVLFGSARLAAIAIDRMLLRRVPRLRQVLWMPLPGRGLRAYWKRVARTKEQQSSE
jgi:hypothetical protein